MKVPILRSSSGAHASGQTKTDRIGRAKTVVAPNSYTTAVKSYCTCSTYSSIVEFVHVYNMSMSMSMFHVDVRCTALTSGLCLRLYPRPCRNPTGNAFVFRAGLRFMAPVLPAGRAVDSHTMMSQSPPVPRVVPARNSNFIPKNAFDEYSCRRRLACSRRRRNWAYHPTPSAGPCPRSSACSPRVSASCTYESVL